MKGSSTSPKQKRSKNSEPSSESSKKRKSASASEKRRSRNNDGNRSRKSSRSRHVVMGLDLSIRATGMVVWDGERVLRRRRYKSEPISVPRDLKDDPPQGQLAPDRFKGEEDERIEWLRRKVATNIRKFGVSLVIIEGHAFMAQGRGKTVLAELHGVVKNLLLRKQIAYVVIAPTTLKKEATGNGKASKVEMIAASHRYDRNIGTDDEADAMHLAVFGNANWRKLVDD